ncbi:hypothetical protein Tco_1406002 [Tanacetum coccineum]
MGDENPRRTLGDYSRPSHEGYRNTIEVPNGNDLAPLQSDTIRLVQGCSFHGLRSEDPNQHLKDFLKITDSIDLNVETRERTRLRKMECEDYHSLPMKSIRKAIMFKRVTRKMGMEGNFVIPCNIGGTRDMSALVDQESDVNIMPLFVYNRLTDKKLVETDVRLALANIKEDVKKPLILGTPFLTTARSEIKFDKGTISLRSRKSTVQFHISPDPFPTLEERDENKINTLSVVNERVLEWEEKIKFHHMKELEFEAWKISGDKRLDFPDGVPTLLRGLVGCAMKPLKSKLNVPDMYIVKVEKLICLRDKQIPSVRRLDSSGKPSESWGQRLDQPSTVMSSSSIVTYTAVYSESEPWRLQWDSDDEMEAPDAALQPLG